MTENTLGQEIIGAIKEALASKESGKVVYPEVDIAAIRKKVGLTQKEFALLYHIKLQTLRNWEQRKRVPDTASLAYLTCIAHRPKLIQKILNQYPV